MTADVWTWSTGWIDVSIVGLAVVAIQGPVVAERTAHKLARSWRTDRARSAKKHAG